MFAVRIMVRCVAALTLLGAALFVPGSEASIPRSAFASRPDLAASVESCFSFQPEGHVLVVFSDEEGVWLLTCRNDPVNNSDPLGLDARTFLGHSFVYEPPLIDYRTGRMLEPGGYREKRDPSYLAGPVDALAPGVEKVEPYVYGTSEFLGGFVWGIGEYQDIDLLVDNDASTWMRWLAGGSLAANVVVPALPNAGGLVRGGTRVADTIASHSDESARIVLRFTKDMNLRDFRRKVLALQDLAHRGKLSRLGESVTRGGAASAYRKALRQRVARTYAGDPQRMNALLKRIDSLHVDHVQDLQLGGVDEATALWLLDPDVNVQLGRQVREQIRNVPSGTKIIDVLVEGMPE
jgi:hypothetical protein